MECYIKDYPRPQLVRKQWTDLNGAWGFAFDDADRGEAEGYGAGFDAPMQITVPFAYETELSGIHDETRHFHVWYSREVEIEKKEGKRILLHFEGADFETKVWVNGASAGKHRGAYARFSFDITDLVKSGTNLIVVKCDDSDDVVQPRGKQRWKESNYLCWYVQTTGIWKSVWMEEVSETYIRELKLTPDLEGAAIEVQAGIGGKTDSPLRLEAEVRFGGQHVTSFSAEVIGSRADAAGSVVNRREREWGFHRWMPQRPELYDLVLRLYRDGELIDEVGSYFGMRDVRIEGSNVLLNGYPLYQRLILDQGYWEKSGITPPDEDALIEDIDKIHALGFNGLRKHMKVEDERFLYWCDVKGMLVWSEMAAGYEFCDDEVQEFTSEWMEVVRQNYSHPSIITWTPFNESWGISEVETSVPQQNFTEAVYYLTKAFDPMRPVICNDGWTHTISDIITLHDYEENGDAFLERYFGRKEEIMTDELYHSKWQCAMARGYEYGGQPVIISEYGGIAFSDKKDGQWGYGNSASGEEDFLDRYRRITDAIKTVPWICGYCYTQVSDVQQEVNGLMYADRKFKISPEKIAEINLGERPSMY